MKVIFLIPSLTGGGAERATASLAVGLALLDRGFEVLIVTEKDLPISYQVPAGIRVLCLRAKSTLRAIRPLVSLIRIERPDIVYSALPHLNSLNSLALGWRRSVAVILSVHNNQARELRAIPRGRLYRIVAPVVYWRAKAVVAVSAGVGTEVAGFIGSAHKVRVIPNPIDLSLLAELADRDTSHAWLGDPTVRTITSMGRLDSQKDFATLLGAFAILHSQEPSARLLVMGEGPERRALEERAELLGVRPYVDFMGFVNNPFALIARSDVFAMSSIYEGFGLAHLEAMACGIPVVATSCDYGPAEILDNGKFGVLVPPGSETQLADALRRVLRDADLRQTLATAGKARAADFDRPRVASMLASLLRVVEAGKLGPPKS